jgi:hypothetical protein
MPWHLHCFQKPCKVTDAGLQNNKGKEIQLSMDRSYEMAGRTETRQESINNPSTSVDYENEQLATSQLLDFDKRIVSVEEAIKKIPDNNPEQAAYMNNLGTLLHQRSLLSSDTTDRERALQALRQASYAENTSFQDRAAYMSNLGVVLARSSPQSETGTKIPSGLGALPKHIRPPSHKRIRCIDIDRKSGRMYPMGDRLYILHE